MPQNWKRIRRNLRAQLRYLLQTGRSSAAIKSFLFDLMPYTTDVPLIRMGGSGDGGYLVPDVLDGVVACFSPGVCDTMTFDMQMMDRGIPSFMADASVEGLVQDHPLATFDKLFIGPKTEGIFISLDDWVARYAPPTGDLVLQMDIEGAEYPTIPATSKETLNRFRIIVLELHSIERVVQMDRLQSYQAFIDRLLEDFTIVHTHGNNGSPMVSAAGITVPMQLEITLMRNDYVKNPVLQTNLPLPLDEPNLPDRPDNVIPAEWGSYTKI